MVSGYFSYNDVVSHSYYTLSYCEDHEDYKYFSFLSVERMSINIPIGISITPKNMANDLKIGWMLCSKLFFQIHLVAKISPATIWAHVAVIPASLDKESINPIKKPWSWEKLSPNFDKPSGEIIITINQRTIGPKKNNGLANNFLVLSDFGCNNIANQNGPTQKVDSIKIIS